MSGQPDQVRVEDRETHYEVVGDRLGVVEHDLGADPTHGFKAAGQALSQDLEALAGEEADVAPAAPAEHGAKAVELAAAGRRLYLADLAEVHDQELPWPRGPGPVDPHVLALPLLLDHRQCPLKRPQRALIAGRPQEPEQRPAADPAPAVLDLLLHHLQERIGQLQSPTPARRMGNPSTPLDDRLDGLVIAADHSRHGSVAPQSS